MRRQLPAQWFDCVGEDVFINGHSHVADSCRADSRRLPCRIKGNAPPLPLTGYRFPFTWGQACRSGCVGPTDRRVTATLCAGGSEAGM